MDIRSKGSGRTALAVVAVAALGVGVAVAFGAGYSAAHASLADHSTYAAKGDAVAYVNGEARTVDGTTKPVGKNGDPITVTPLPGGGAAAVNNRTHRVTTINGATLTPTATVTTEPGKTPPQVVASGNGGWVVDPNGKDVTPLVKGKPGRAVHLPASPVDSAPGTSGSLIVLGADGKLRQVTTSDTTDIDVDPTSAGSLTAAGGHSYLVTGTGSVIEVDGSTPTTVATIRDALQLGTDGRITTGALQTGGSHVLVISGDSLYVVDPASGKDFPVLLRTGSDALGRPVEYRGQAFVPDYTKHDVLQVDEQSQTVVHTIRVPGDASTFALYVNGGMLWANDQYAQHMLVIDEHGNHSLDKGSGDGVSDPSSRRQSQRNRTHRTLKVPVDTPPTNTPNLGGGSGGTRPSTNPGGTTPGGNTGPTTPPTKTVQVPSFGSSITYQAACASLQAKQLRCQPVAAGNSGPTDTVISTSPSGGASVAVGSTVVVSYSGPIAVPSVTGSTPADACHAVEAAHLRCTAQPESSPGGTFGAVSSSSPQGGAQVPTGTSVTVSYDASFTMPDEAGQQATQACQKLSAMTIALPSGSVSPRCTVTTGSSDGPAGTVVDQDPPKGSMVAVHAGTTITLTQNSGMVTIPNWSQPDSSGLTPDPNTISQDCAKLGITCNAQTGDAPVPPALSQPTPSEAGRFEKSDPPGGQKVQVGSTITVYFYSGNGGGVPNVQNLSPPDACNAIMSAGYSCQQQDVPEPPSVALNQVIAQNPGNGATQALGAPVTITFTTYQTIYFRQFQRTDSYTIGKQNQGNTNDNILAQSGPNAPPPQGFDDARVHFSAYAAGSLPGGITIDNYSCTNCYGNTPATDDYLPPGQAPAGMTDHGPQFDLIPPSNGTCSAQGEVAVYNVVQQPQPNGDGGTKIYTWSTNIGAVPSGQGVGSALLGCAWDTNA